jgi:uncharacterized protein (TIGR00369 family)
MDDPKGLIFRFFNQEIPFNQHLGMVLTELGPGRAVMELPYKPELVGDAGRPALHGGVLSSLMDAAGGAAAFSRVKVPADTLSTIDLRVDYLRPAELRTVIAEATVMRMGNRVACVDIRCTHEGDPDHLIATGKAVYSVKRDS